MPNQFFISVYASKNETGFGLNNHYGLASLQFIQTVDFLQTTLWWKFLAMLNGRGNSWKSFNRMNFGKWYESLWIKLIWCSLILERLLIYFMFQKPLKSRKCSHNLCDLTSCFSLLFENTLSEALYYKLDCRQLKNDRV